MIMRKSRKIIAAISITIIVIGVPGVFILSNVMKLGQKATPFNLDNAPDHIINNKAVLKEKLENGTFSIENDWEIFLSFSQWMADNNPDILDLIKDWEKVVYFRVENSTYDMWWLIGNDSLRVEIGTNPPDSYGILIDLSYIAFTEILKEDATPLSAFQEGDLKYEGPFNEVIKVSQIVLIVSATVMDTYIPSTFAGPLIEISTDEQDLYIEGGLTLFPVFDITIKPDRIGEHHSSSIGAGSVVIVNHKGKIVAKLDDSGHSIHKFINSTTIMMGGQEGFMELWDYKTDTLTTLVVPAGHHEIDYNPVTETFMVLDYVWSNETWDGKKVVYDYLSEYNYAGELIWQWDPRIYFPFNYTRHTSLGLNETFRGGADWMHSNSFVWDKSNEMIYLLVRNQDTILKINYTSKEVIWDAGRGGDFTLINKAGEEVYTLFAHPHSLERIDTSRFILYDNDLYNKSNPSTMTLENSSGHSRHLEFEIDEENHIMREIWSWIPNNDTYFLPESGGDSDRLPDGNTLGIFGNKGLILNLRNPPIVTEVTKEGKIAWEMYIPGKNNAYYWVHRVERFYEKPIVIIHNQSIDLNRGDLWLNFSTWNTFKQEATSIGEFNIIVDGQEFYQESFEFLPQWQQNTFNLSFNDLPSKANVIELIVENDDNIQNIIVIYKKTSDFNSQYGSILLILGGLLVATPITVFSLKKIRKNRDFQRELDENTLD